MLANSFFFNPASILFTDETKIEIFGHNDKKLVRRPIGKAFHPKFTIKTVKHGGGNIKVWGCFSRNGPGKIHLIEGNMDAKQYIEIIKKNVKSSARMIRMRRGWQFWQDNDPKHTGGFILLHTLGPFMEKNGLFQKGVEEGKSAFTSLSFKIQITTDEIFKMRYITSLNSQWFQKYKSSKLKL